MKPVFSIPGVGLRSRQAADFPVRPYNHDDCGAKCNQADGGTGNRIHHQAEVWLVFAKAGDHGGLQRKDTHQRSGKGYGLGSGEDGAVQTAETDQVYNRQAQSIKGIGSGCINNSAGICIALIIHNHLDNHAKHAQIQHKHHTAAQSAPLILMKQVLLFGGKTLRASDSAYQHPAYQAQEDVINRDGPKPQRGIQPTGDQLKTGVNQVDSQALAKGYGPPESKVIPVPAYCRMSDNPLYDSDMQKAGFTAL